MKDRPAGFLRTGMALLALAICMFALAPPPSSAQTQLYDAFIAPTTADSAGVLLQVPAVGRTIRVKTITLWYDNAANTNPVYAGIVQATAAQVRELWLGEAMATSGIKGITYTDINRKLTGSTAQAGVRLFVQGTASDTLSADVFYEILAE